MAALRLTGSAPCSATLRSSVLPALWRLEPAPPVAETLRFTRGGMVKPKPLQQASRSIVSTLKMCLRECEE